MQQTSFQINMGQDYINTTERRYSFRKVHLTVVHIWSKAIRKVEVTSIGFLSNG